MVTVAMLYPGHSAEDEFSTLQSHIRNAAFPVIHTWEGPTEHDIYVGVHTGLVGFMLRYF